MIKPPMTISNLGLFEIAAHEGLSLKPYYDSVGVITIGFGHTANSGAHSPIIGKRIEDIPELTLSEAIRLFMADIHGFCVRVNKAFDGPLRQYEFDAAVSFDYNTGGIDEAWWVRTFNEGDRELAVRQIMNWCKPSEVIPRREAEQTLFDSGKYSRNKIAHYTQYADPTSYKLDYKNGVKMLYYKEFYDALPDNMRGMQDPQDPKEKRRSINARIEVNGIIYTGLLYEL